jgi:hypothetical protein
LGLLHHAEGEVYSFSKLSGYTDLGYSGTNGYVVRNLSHLRSRDPQQDMRKFEQAPPKHREPDAGILEHERLRSIEVRCLELQLELEENGYVCARSGHEMNAHFLIAFLKRILSAKYRSSVSSSQPV